MCGCWNFAGTTPHHFCRYRGAAALVNEALFLQLSEVELAACATWALKWVGFSGSPRFAFSTSRLTTAMAFVWMDYQGPQCLVH